MRALCLLVCILAAVLCAGYGFVIRAAGSGTAFFLVWFTIAAAFLGSGLLRYLGLWEKVPGVFRNGALVLAAAGIIALLVVEGLVIGGMHQEEKKNLDYILILGAQVREDGPSIVLKYRLDKAVEYLEENPDTICIVSGGKGYNEPFSEAEGMAEYLFEQGIAKERLVLETESKTTAQNIQFSRRFIEEGAKVGILTNDFHMFRALQIARSQGMESACGIAADSSKLYLPNNMLREFFAEMKFLILRYI